MKPFFLILLGLVFISASAHAQIDYKIDGARTVKMGYKPFPRDMRTAELDWVGLESDCVDNLSYGSWFELKLKSDKVKFNVHTGGKFGDIKDPKLYLGRVVETSSGRSIQEICCVAHEGNDGVFSIESVGLDPKGTHFVLVAANEEKASFAISATDDFEPIPPREEEEKIVALNRIFGRILTKSGDGKANIKVSLLDEQQQAITTSLTDDRGVFKFEKLEPDAVFLTKVEADDTELEVEMFLIDAKGSITSRATRIGERLYGFGVDQGLSKYIRLLALDDYDLDVPKGKKGVVGRVVDKQTFLYGREGVEVGLYNKQRKLMESSTTDDRGLFSFVVSDDQEYDVQVKSDAEKDFTEIVIVDELSVPVEVANSNDMDEDGFFKFSALPQEVVEMKRMEVVDTQMKLPSNFANMNSGKSIVLENILFGYGSADLLASSFEELNRLVVQLKKMSSVKIEVAGHTDDQGSESTNLILSENRAKAVVDYLISKGIDRSRLTFKGYGESQPIASNENEKGRKVNRRVEFKVVD